MGAAGTERFGSACRSEAKTKDVRREEEGGRQEEGGWMRRGGVFTWN